MSMYSGVGLAERVMTVELARSRAFVGLVAELASSEYPLESEQMQRWGRLCHGLVVPLMINLASECYSESLIQCATMQQVESVLHTALAESQAIASELRSTQVPEGGHSAIRELSSLADSMEVGLGFTSHQLDPSVGTIRRTSPTTTQVIALSEEVSDKDSVAPRVAVFGYCTLWQPRLAGLLRKSLKGHDGQGTNRNAPAITAILESLRKPNRWIQRKSYDRSRMVEEALTAVRKR